jgi:hypothetical protein
VDVLQDFQHRSKRTETSVPRIGFEFSIQSSSWLPLIPPLITDGYFNCRSLVPIPTGRNYSAFNYKLIFHLSNCCPIPRVMLATVDCIAVVGTAMGNPVRLLPGRQLITQLLHVAILGSNPPPTLTYWLLWLLTVLWIVTLLHAVYTDRRTCNAATLHRHARTHTNTHSTNWQRRDRPADVRVLCYP